MRSSLLLLLPLLLGAGPATPDPSHQLAGRYDEQFPDGLVTGETYTGNNIVEIVPVAPGAAYVRIHLDYYNGHVCGIWGVARAEADALVYRDPRPNTDGSHCVLSVRKAGKSLSINDGDSSCKGYCGERGTLTKVRLPYASKRPIGYLPRLERSRQYRQALAEWHKRAP